jgi:cysteinyl-tRNA synthetase
MKEIGTKYFNAFVDDLKILNIEMPEKFPLASEHIREDVELIAKLAERGFAYKTSDGMYFDTAKFPAYGKLGGISEKDNASRIGVNSEKKNQRDFSLWKFDSKIGWESPWGKGFPGWHIECSAMSRKYLGQPFDLHTGGIDHIPVHHNNEIAQSEAAYGTPLANYWLHNAFVTMNDGKMAKSAGGSITLNTLRQDSISPIAFRYWLLTAHYRSPINFSLEAVRGAQNALIRLMSTISQYNDGGSPIKAYIDRFHAYMNDDLDTPQAVALTWELIRDAGISDADKLATLLDFDRILGLGLNTIPKVTESESIPDEIAALVDAREEARKIKDWKKSDALRAEIESRGYEVKDTEKGVRVVKNN